MNVVFQPKDSTQKSIEVQTPVLTIQVLPQEKQKALTLAPPMPLEPEYPLGLTKANHQFLHEGPGWKREKLLLQQEISRHTFPWLALSIFIGASGIAWMAYLMRDQLPSWSWKKKPPLTLIQKAEESLSTLKQQNFIEQELHQQYASGLSSILLELLEDLSGKSYKMLTTKEVSSSLADYPPFTSVRNNIMTILTEADQIKFARKEFSSKEADELQKKILSVVKQVVREKYANNL
jgi:hypothetical protein